MSGRLPLSSDAPANDAGGARRTIQRVAAIAFSAILLGLVMQGLILAAKLAGGGAFYGTQFLVDVAQGVTWSLVVCLGAGVATLLVKVRAVMAGLLSMLCAPVALALARSSQKVMASMIGAADNPAVLSVGAISALKAIEYGLLGWLLALLVQRSVDRAPPYLGVGAIIGAIFGGAIMILSHQVALASGKTLSQPQLIGMTINEIVFPIGCALVVYIGLVARRSLGILEGQIPGR
jgi:hypothetical protein